ncbi:MAG: hypothetical protein JXR49_15455 [Acidobacteria bacterium]|nr:hypothetical protein [Acidobacteriota bacterium]
MKRPAAVIGSMCFSLVLSVLASGQTGNFSGKWILNNEKSDSEPRVTPIGRTASPRKPIGRTVRPHPPLKNPPGAKSSANLPPTAKIPSAAPGGGTSGNRIGYVYGSASFDGSTPVADDVPLVITQTAKQMRIVNALKVKGANVPNTETYTLDGKKYEKTIQGISGTELKREIKASLKKNKITIEVVTLDPQGRKFRTTREFSLSEDGQTLTVELSSQSQNYLSSQKMVYDKN